MSVLDLRDRLRPQLPRAQAATPVAPETARAAATPSPPETPAFVVEDPETGRTVLTMPAEVAAAPQAEDFLLRLSGRLVEAEKANDNGAFWAQDDLQFGLPSIAYGPLNWLHEERKVVGVLTQARLVEAANDEREAARSFSAEQRRKLASAGKAMPDGSFPIVTTEDLRNAIRLAHTPAQRRHVIRRARALGATNLIPDTWKREKAAADVGTHIEADAQMWRWLYPRESREVAAHAAQRQLWYSMECISQEVACVGEGGCGAQVPYLDALNRTEKACEHLRERSSLRRFVNPIFQGAAIIVPPTRPGWAKANLAVQRQAANFVTDHELALPDLSQTDAETMVAQVLQWSRG